MRISLAWLVGTGLSFFLAFVFPKIPNPRKSFPSHPGVYDDVEDMGSQLSHWRSVKPTRSNQTTKRSIIKLYNGKGYVTHIRWLNISLDPVQGTNQTQMTYSSRIWTYFNEHKTFARGRTPTCLCNRWSAIQTSVSKVHWIL